MEYELGMVSFEQDLVKLKLRFTSDIIIPENYSIKINIESISFVPNYVTVNDGEVAQLDSIANGSA